MTRDEWRLTARLISRRVLRQHMAYRKLKTGYALAKACDFKNPSRVNNLLRDRTTCSPDTAQAIEEALDVVPGSLFAVETVRVADTQHARTAA